MKSNTKTLTEGPLAKQIFLVSLPLALSNLLQVLFNMSDVAVVGRFAGSTALGAVGSTSILVSLFTGFLIGLQRRHQTCWWPASTVHGTSTMWKRLSTPPPSSA